MNDDRLLDVAIIGGGIAGVVHLHCARQAGLDALVFERQPAVGGLWCDLPAWQDIQISPVDWAVGDLPLAGPLQAQVLANIQAWVQRFDLADGIRLNCPVQHARHTGRHWTFDTPQGPRRARHLVAASGAHNKAFIPGLERQHSEVLERHASNWHQPAEAAGRDVLVVGGGASAFDLIEQCLQHGAQRIHWAHRGLRWFMPTSKPKAVAGSVRPFAKLQASGMTAAQITDAIGADMRGRYAHFGIQAIQPAQPLDLMHDQLIPGRPQMLKHFGEIDRHAACVVSMEGRSVSLDDGTQLNADLLLWGTGYQTDLSYFDDPRIAAIRSTHALGARCACIFRSLDAPDLYFPAVGLDGIGAAPWANLLLARSIISHIRGTAQLDMVPLGHKVNHFDIVQHLAPRDTGAYPPGRAWDFYRQLALNTPDDQPYPLP